MTELKTGRKLRYFRYILFSTWFLAAVPAVMIFLFLPPLASRYTVLLEDFNIDHYDHKYCDLDSDSISELISTGKGIPYYYVVVQTNDRNVHDQWNLMDSLNPRISECYFGNYDNDRYKEIYIFSYKGDSLFLNANEILDPKGLILERKFITKISVIRKEVTSNLSLAGFYDVNGDGSKEIYFTIQTGFGLEPRRVFYYDLIRGRVHISDFTGSVCQEPMFNDPDGDGKPELFGLLTASGNHHDKVPFSDSSTWLMVFNENLRFEFPPVEFPGYTNRLETSSFSGSTFRGYVVSHNTTSVDTSIMKPCLMLYSLNGSLVKSRFFNELDRHRSPVVAVRNIENTDRIFFLGNSFYELDTNLEPVQKAESPFKSAFSVYHEDIADDSDKEMLLYSDSEEKLVIYGKDFTKIAELGFKAVSRVWDISHNFTGDGKHKLFVNADKQTWSISVERNSAYALGYLLYPGIYLVLCAFILVIKKINTFQVVQKEQLKRRLLTLQLQSIKSQLDPHFTFNALNSVASLVYLDDRKAAYDSLNKFTNLIRRLLSDAERIYRTLNEELEFVRLYLDLERLRFGDRLNYSIVCDESLTGNEQVPKMVLQTFAENAVKHGITARPSGGSLLIEVRRDNGFLLLTVLDDGIGRFQASGHSSSTGRGLKLTDEFYDILNRMSNRQIRHKITDLTDYDGNATGTKVEVWIPLLDKAVEEAL